MEIKWIEETTSTNSWLSERCAEFPGDIAVATRRQTAGRGQRGNSWESEPDRNLTFSLLRHPRHFAARDQFAISEAVALGVADWLAVVGVEAKVKWPNDIYAGDRKICGILIEHSVTGMEIDHTIAGIGININQETFVSDAPNPVSVIQITGQRLDLPEALKEVCDALGKRLLQIETEEGRRDVHREFLDRMWRRDGNAHPFRDTASGELYYGNITDVDSLGYLSVKDVGSGVTRRYAFKEVEFVL